MTLWLHQHSWNARRNERAGAFRPHQRSALPRLSLDRRQRSAWRRQSSRLGRRCPSNPGQAGPQQPDRIHAHRRWRRLADLLGSARTRCQNPRPQQPRAQGPRPDRLSEKSSARHAWKETHCTQRSVSGEPYKVSTHGWRPPAGSWLTEATPTLVWASGRRLAGRGNTPPPARRCAVRRARLGRRPLAATHREKAPRMEGDRAASL